MRILLVHNRYGSSAPSGENVVVDLERALLASRGHAVRVFFRESDEIRRQGSWGTLKGAAATPWNPWTVPAIRRELAAFQPDVLHAHNTFPLLSPSVFDASRGRVARVLTLHNYRLFCAAGIPLREGRACTSCIDSRSVKPALRHGCYRSSRAATLPLALGVAIARRRRTWERDVEVFIALTEFQREVMVNGGLPAERVVVKPNFFPGEPTVLPWDQRSSEVVFVGRLSVEKGVRTLVEAWRQWGEAAPVLKIIGDGPQRGELEALVSTHQLRRVRFLGQVSGPTAQAEIARSKLLVVPSVWFEGFPLVLREAFALGTPAGVSNIGGLPALVGPDVSGFCFDPGSSPSLLAAARKAWETPALLERLGAGARAQFVAHYSENANAAALESIYRRAIDLFKEQYPRGRRPA